MKRHLKKAAANIGISEPKAPSEDTVDINMMRILGVFRPDPKEDPQVSLSL